MRVASGDRGVAVLLHLGWLLPSGLGWSPQSLLLGSPRQFLWERTNAPLWGGGRERHVLRLAEFPERRPRRQEGGCAHTSHHVTARGPVASARAHSADEPEAQGTPLHHQAPEAARLWPVCGDRGPSALPPGPHSRPTVRWRPALPRCDSVTAPSVPTIRSLAQQQGHTRQLVYTGPVPSLSPRTEDGSRELPQPGVSSAPVCAHPKCQRLGVSGRRGRVAAALPPPACG